MYMKDLEQCFRWELQKVLIIYTSTILYLQKLTLRLDGECGVLNFDANILEDSCSLEETFDKESAGEMESSGGFEGLSKT